jgi:hypothetical protein
MLLTAGTLALTTLASSLATAGTAAAAGLGGAAATGAAATGVTAGTIATGVGTAGTLAAVAGAGANIYGQIQASEASKKQEAIRQKQMALEARKARIDAIRRTQQARATGLVNQSGAGIQISGGGTSAYGGLVGQAESGLASSIQNINTGEALGSALFAANAAESEARGISGVGGGLFQLGTNAANNADSVGRLFATA